MGNNIIASIVNNIGSHGNEEAVRFKHNDSKDWESYTWDELSGLVRQISAALLNLGLKLHENVAIFSQK